MKDNTDPTAALAPHVTHRVAVSYIDKSREYYLERGHGNPYRWAYHEEVPFMPLPKPLAESRAGLVCTAMPSKEFDLERQVYSAPTDPPPEALYTQRLFWHKTATHTNDIESYLPVRRLNEYAADGRIGSLSPRFYGVPTQYSQRQTTELHAPAILEMCQEDQVDVALLIPL